MLVIGEPAAFEKLTFASAAATGKEATFELPPPGVGFTTVIEAVAAVAISAAGTSAVSCPWFTNVVASAAPLKLTVEVGRKPVPFKVSENPGPPGGTASGTSGWFKKGTGLPLMLFE